MVFSLRLHPHTRLEFSVTKSRSGTRRFSTTGAVTGVYWLFLPSRLFQVMPPAVTVQLP